VSARRLGTSVALSTLAVAALVVATCGRPHKTGHGVRHLVHPVVRHLEGALESPVEHALSIDPKLPPMVVYLDAGHGAEGNPGASSCTCQDEQDFTRLLALDVRDDLERTGHFRVILSRTAGELVSYADRLAEAERAHVDALVSLHSDVRGTGTPREQRAGKACLENLASPGFVVLYSDEGDADLVARRLDLARAISGRMAETGFVRYTGTYGGLYAIDAQDPAVLVDRHEPKKRIFVLRRPAFPSVIVETHHALDPREALLWESEEARHAFAAALAQALTDFQGRHARP
jgi:N-acetylmuramoyl-L-alanine amidase